MLLLLTTTAHYCCSLLLLTTAAHYCPLLTDFQSPDVAVCLHLIRHRHQDLIWPHFAWSFHVPPPPPVYVAPSLSSSRHSDLQHSPQHSAVLTTILYNTLQHSPQHSAVLTTRLYNILQHSAALYNMLQHSAALCSFLSAALCSTLPHAGRCGHFASGTGTTTPICPPPSFSFLVSGGESYCPLCSSTPRTSSPPFSPTRLPFTSFTSGVRTTCPTATSPSPPSASPLHSI